MNARFNKLHGLHLNNFFTRRLYYNEKTPWQQKNQPIAALPEWRHLLSGCWGKDHKTFYCCSSSGGSECDCRANTLDVSEQSRAKTTIQRYKAKSYSTALWALSERCEPSSRKSLLPRGLLPLTGKALRRWTLEFSMMHVVNKYRLVRFGSKFNEVWFTWASLQSNSQSNKKERRNALRRKCFIINCCKNTKHVQQKRKSQNIYFALTRQRTASFFYHWSQTS